VATETDDLQDIGRKILEFDPRRPQIGFFSTASAIAAAQAADIRADPVQFPPGLAPVLDTPHAPPNPSDPLPHADVIIVTWTVAEADTLATLLTPGVSIDDWFQYKSNLAHYIPLVVGAKAPFNNKGSSRYFHSLGIYYPIKLVGKKVLCIKSGLHLDHDTFNKGQPAPDQLPMLDLWKQMIAETKASLVITVGTGGAIGSNVLLGDVVVAKHTVFDCTTQFAGKPFHNSSYPTSALPAAWSPPPAALLKVNADKVIASGQPSHPHGLPAVFYDGSAIADPKIVTTDFFGFDNTTDSDGLQALGNACDMGDASLGLVISGLGNAAPMWSAIRNASDPQIDGKLTKKQQGDLAFKIYSTYGAATSAASALASWSMVCAHFPPAPAPAGLTPAAVATTAAEITTASRSLAKNRQREMRSDPSHLLMQLAAGSQFEATDLEPSAAPADTAAALDRRLQEINVDVQNCVLSWRRIRFLDDAERQHELFLVHASCDEPEAFRGSYLYAGPDLITKEEFISG
jgi:hypothetical protein